MRSLLPALLAAAALAGCGSDDEQPAAPAPADATRLTITVTEAAPDPIRIELRCGGDDPCERSQLRKLERIAKPDDPTRACTLVYGGPEKARIAGTLAGEPVDVTVTRSDGCGIAEYEALFAALGRKPPLRG
jgi:hypothetical protein